MAGEAASDRAELQQAIREGLALVRQEVASLEKQLLASAEARPQGVEAQRTQTGGGTVVGARIEQQLATVAEAVRQLTRAGDELERTVGGLLDNAQKTEMRVSALSSLADAGARRLHTLEQGISEALNRLTVPAAEGTKELGRAMPGDTSTTRWADGAPVSMTLLDAIDRQLRDAEIRLALRSSRPYPD
jgi:phage-related tail protein